MTIPTTCEENAILQSKMLLFLCRQLGATDADILGIS